MGAYIGQCDRIRRTEVGENFFQELINNRYRATEEFFLSHASVEAILDEDETFQDWKSSVSDTVEYYSSLVHSREYVFLKTCGFEFVWAC